ncbi:MAG: cysteine desulfurase [Chloroflexi bacterium]|nr:MAG: cysteine desulfurase [Chloroflexota bacterium]
MSIYLDHASTTPLRREALEAMLPYLSEHWGNPSSIHHSGRRARQGLDEARESVAMLLGAKPREIVFTSGGTESDNLAISGVAWAASARGRHIVTTAIEHKAVLQECALLGRHGFDVTYVGVDGDGLVDPEAVAAAINERTVLVSVMAANNEVGTVQPVAEIGSICRARRVAFHVDAVQAAPFLPIDVNAWQADVVSISGHKLYGPKGIGALFVRQGTAMVPLLQGGAQERQRRAGTENVAAAVGLATAFALAADEAMLTAESSRLSGLRDALLAGLTVIPGVHRTGHATQRLPNSASVVIDGIEGGDLVAALDLEGIEASTGSACTTGSVEPSHVLLAMGIDAERARGSLRLTLGRENTEADVVATIDAVERGVARLRAAAPAREPAEAPAAMSAAPSV